MQHFELFLSRSMCRVASPLIVMLPFTLSFLRVPVKFEHASFDREADFIKGKTLHLICLVTWEIGGVRFKLTWQRTSATVCVLKQNWIAAMSKYSPQYVTFLAERNWHTGHTFQGEKASFISEMFSTIWILLSIVSWVHKAKPNQANYWLTTSFRFNEPSLMWWTLSTGFKSHGAGVVKSLLLVHNVNIDNSWSLVPNWMCLTFKMVWYKPYIKKKLYEIFKLHIYSFAKKCNSLKNFEMFDSYTTVNHTFEIVYFVSSTFFSEAP